MQENRGMQSGEGVLANFRYRRKWKWITSVLSVFVVIGTVSALMLPAITMNQYSCGMDEHTHGSDCYEIGTELHLACGKESLQIHAHSTDCKNEAGDLICGQADYVVHTHDANCYSAGGELVCTLKEVKEHAHNESCYQISEVVTDEGHSHGDDCWEWVISEAPTCGVEESSGHSHGEVCYATGAELICATEENEGHTHGESCYQTVDTLSCMLAEEPGHTHGTECYGEDGALLCGLAESSGHAHDASCYTQSTVLSCQVAENPGHQHGTECYAEAGTLLCTIAENPGHAHTEECFGLVRGELTCTEEEREPVIEAGEPELICEKPEVVLHTHKGTCYEYDQDGNVVAVICGELEVLAHQHTESCFADQEVKSLICTVPAHTHTDDCRSTGEPPQPTEDVTEPTGEPPQPTEDVTEPTGEPPQPTEDVTEPTGEPPQPTEDATEPTDEPTQPTEDATEPTDELPQPTEDTTEPTEESTPPTDEELAQAQAAVDFISALPDIEALRTQWADLKELGALDQWNAEMDQLDALLLEARNLYAEVTLIAQSYVTNVDKLVSLEELLEEHRGLLGQILQEEIDLVIAMIESLPQQEDILALQEKSELTEEETDYLAQFLQNVEAAYDGWNTLRPQQKANVTNFSKLEALLPLLTRVLAQEEYPAFIYTDESLTEQHLTSIAITVIGQLPEGAQVNAFPVDAQISGGKTLYAFDIRITLEDGTEYQPQDPVTVRISGLTLDSNKTLGLYYIPSEGDPEELLYSLENGKVCFEVNHFSVYALADVTYQSLPEVELPTVGGPGILPCILGGLSLMSASLLAYCNKKGKKEESDE